MQTCLQWYIFPPGSIFLPYLCLQQVRAGDDERILNPTSSKHWTDLHGNVVFYKTLFTNKSTGKSEYLMHVAVATVAIVFFGIRLAESISLGLDALSDKIS